MLHLTDAKNKPFGKLYLDNFSIKSHYSFMDLYSKHGINIVPIVAVDYSLANLTFNQQQYTIHTLKENTPNDYIDCLGSIGKAFHHFNRFMLSYGFGAKTVMDPSMPTSNVFATSGDFKKPFAKNGEELINNYKSTLKNVTLSLPAVQSDIVKFVCDLAEREGQDSIKDIKNYYVLVIMMAGMVDDFRETIRQMLRAQDLPLSILVIKMGANKEEND
jgi:hypothetical protein